MSYYIIIMVLSKGRQCRRHYYLSNLIQYINVALYIFYHIKKQYCHCLFIFFCFFYTIPLIFSTHLSPSLLPSSLSTSYPPPSSNPAETSPDSPPLPPTSSPLQTSCTLSVPSSSSLLPLPSSPSSSSSSLPSLPP